MMKPNLLSKLFGASVCALILSAIFPIAAFGQGRSCSARLRRSRWIVYQPRSYVLYQRRPYRSPVYDNRRYYPSGYGYDYNQPYYGNRYYAYRSSQPYFANRYTSSWVNPTYRYNESWYGQRHRTSGLRIGIRLR